MGQLVQQVIASLGSVTVVIGAAAWWLKAYLERRLDMHFKSLEKINETIQKMQSDRVKASYDSIQDLLLLSSQARNRLRKLVKDPTEDNAQKFCEAADQYSARLYASELVIPLDEWKVLHSYKRLIDPLATTIYALRAADYIASKDRMIQCETTLKNVERAHSKIRIAIRERFDSITTSPWSTR